MPFLQPNMVQCSGNHIELFDRFGVLAFERQCDLQKSIQGMDWNLDMNKGEITFGKKIRAEIQLIGSFAQSNKSWLWSWANEESDVPKSRLLQSLRLKEIGESNGIPQFTTPCFDTEEMIGHLFAMIASGLFGASGYYPGDFGNGHVFVTISSPQIDEFSSSQNHVIPSVFSQFIMAFPANHKKALKYYLLAKGFAVETDENKIIGTKSSDELTAEFDNQNRLISFVDHLTSKPKKKKWWFF